MARDWNPIGARDDDFKSRGMEKGLLIAMYGMLRRLKKLPVKFPMPTSVMTPRKDDGYVRGTRGTPNHQFGAKICYYLRAMIAGTKEQQDDARGLVLQSFREQATTAGHMKGELGTTSHYQIWIAEVACLRAAAIHFGDQAVIEASGQWLRRDYYLLDLWAFDGVPKSPGARPTTFFDKKGVEQGVHDNGLRTAIYSIYNRTPCPDIGKGWGDPNELGGKFYSSAYCVGAWALQEMIADGDKLGGVRLGKQEVAVLSDDMDVWVNGSAYVMSIKHFTKSGPKVLPWISRIGGVESGCRVFKGEFRNWDCPVPPPRLPGARLITVKGVRA